jgi:hypothetical protein
MFCKHDVRNPAELSTISKYHTTGNRLFAECPRALGKEPVGKGFFAECRMLGTRQSLCRVSNTYSAKRIPPSTWTDSLPSAERPALGKEFFIFLGNCLPSANQPALGKESFFILFF